MATITLTFDGIDAAGCAIAGTLAYNGDGDNPDPSLGHFVEALYREGYQSLQVYAPADMAIAYGSDLVAGIKPSRHPNAVAGRVWWNGWE
jgi:hypothetical protein